MRASRFDVDLEIDRQEPRGQLVRRHRRVHPPHGGHILGLLARCDLDERLALAFVGVLVDNHLHRGVALVDGAGELCEQCSAEPVEADVAEMSLTELDDGRCLTEAVRSANLLIDRATVRTIAISKLVAADAPFDHDLPPCEPKVRECPLARLVRSPLTALNEKVRGGYRVSGRGVAHEDLRDRLTPRSAGALAAFDQVGRSVSVKHVSVGPVLVHPAPRIGPIIE